MDRLEAASEWVVRTESGLDERYAATLNEVAKFTDARDDVPLQEHLVESTPLKEPGIQLLVRKCANGTTELVLNGRRSTGRPSPLAVGVSEHVLPRFRMDSLMQEDATGNSVASPVIAGLLVEEGASVPDMVKLQVMQRTFVGGVQLDAGSETVAAEMELSPTLPSSIEADCVAVGYPIALTAPADLEIVDNAAAEQLQRNAREGIVRTILTTLARAGGSDWTGAFRTAVQRLPGAAILLSLFGAGVSAVLEAGPLMDVNVPVTVQTGIALSALAEFLMRYLNRNTETTQDRVNRAQRRVNISVFDLPALIRRVVGYQRGGVYSAMGRAVTLDELKEARRFDDVVFIQTLQRLKQQEDELKEINAELQKVNVPDAQLRETMAELRKLNDNALPNIVKFTNIDAAELQRKGYVESYYRIEVVDTNRDAAVGRTTFLVTSDRSFFAGIVASGYRKLQENLNETVDEVALAISYDIDPFKSPLIRSIRPVNSLAQAVSQRIVGNNRQEFWPSVNALLARLRALAKQVDASLGALVDDPDKQTVTLEAATVRRRLPHVVRMRNNAGMAFVLAQNSGIQVLNESESVVSSLENGLRNVVAASAATLRIVRQATGQFIQADGILRARLCLVLHTTGFPLPENALPRIPNRSAARCDATIGIRTTNFYTARLPADVIGAIERHAQHTRLVEAMSIEWMCTERRTSSHKAKVEKSVASTLQLPATHEGELVAGVLVDLAVEELLRRTRSSLATSPTREQLMHTAAEYAVRQLRLASAVAQRTLYSGSRPLRISNEDAFYDCYPGGMALLRLLHESAIWRSWHAPWTQRNAYCTGGLTDRFGLVEASAHAVPEGLTSLTRMLDLLRNVRIPETLELLGLPFLSAQTMEWHTVHTLPLVLADGSYVPRELGHESTRQHAWLMLAAQIEASYDAACRVSVLASGMRIDRANTHALLRETVAARPILDLAARVSVNDAPLAARESARLRDVPVARVDDGTDARPLQPGLPRVPRTSTLLDNRQPEIRVLFQTRLAMLRFDSVRRRAEERVLDNESGQALLDRFSGLSINAHNDATATRREYLVAFGGAFVAELSPTTGRHFEGTAIFSAMLSHPVLSTATGFARLARLRGRIDPESAHPFLLGIDDSTTVDATLVPVPAVVQSDENDPEGESSTQSLRELWERLQRAKQLPSFHGTGVDAASCLLFNVERVVQSLLLLVGHGYDADTVVVFTPPPQPATRLVRTRAPPAELPVLQRARSNVHILALSLTSSGIDALAAIAFPTAATKATEWRSNLVSTVPVTGRPNDTQQQYIADILKPFANNRETNDSLAARLYEALNPTLPAPTTEVAIAATNDPATVTAYIQRYVSKPVTAALVPVLAPPPQPSASTQIPPPATAPPAPPSGLASRIVAAEKFTNAWRASLEQMATLTTKTNAMNAYAEAENRARVAVAETARAHELSLWPATLAIAQAAAATLVTSVPSVRIDSVAFPNGEQSTDWQNMKTAMARWSDAVDAWRARGLLAVPLSELVAVVTRV